MGARTEPNAPNNESRSECVRTHETNAGKQITVTRHRRPGLAPARLCSGLRAGCGVLQISTLRRLAVYTHTVGDRRNTLDATRRTQLS